MSNQDQVKTVDPKLKLALARDPRALTIIEFIKSKQTATTGVTMDQVAKHMNEKGLCSRPTTRMLLFSLLREKILKEKERRNKYFHDLVIDEGYDFEGLLEEVFLSHAENIKESIKPFENLMKDKKVITNHQVNKNPKHGLNELLLGVFVINYKPRPKDVLTHRQAIEYENRIENKMMKKGMKHSKKNTKP